MSGLAFERGQCVVVKATGHTAEVIWSDDTWTVLLARNEYPPWTQTIDTAFARERCDEAARRVREARKKRGAECQA